MKRFISMSAVAVVCAMFAGAALRAEAVHTGFVGGVGFQNPCNGEIVIGTGPVKIVYSENENGAHYVMHSTFRVKAVGSLGNEYVVSFETNEQFDAPSGSGQGYIYFDSPINGQVTAKGKALNFKWDLYARTYVSNGVATGGQFIGPSTAECQGH